MCVKFSDWFPGHSSEAGRYAMGYRLSENRLEWHTGGGQLLVGSCFLTRSFLPAERSRTWPTAPCNQMRALQTRLWAVWGLPAGTGHSVHKPSPHWSQKSLRKYLMGEKGKIFIIHVNIPHCFSSMYLFQTTQMWQNKSCLWKNNGKAIFYAEIFLPWCFLWCLFVDDSGT